MKTRLSHVLLCLWIITTNAQSQTNLTNRKIDGYRGIWFELNQKYEHGDKYSGALSTYTAKHMPLAVYSPKVNKTFFVYGGTISEMERYLLCMIGYYDHETGMVSKPTVVYDKKGVDDPHDNPSLMIDDDGYIWVFISGRGQKRPGFKYRSKLPFNIDSFDEITSEEMTYPQPWKTDLGYFHFFTKYTGVRLLYFETSIDGIHWSEDQLLAAIPQKVGEQSGHYQVSGMHNNRKLGTFFNRHPNGNVDKRTDLYYVETRDLGKTWRNVQKNKLTIPLIERENEALVIDYQSMHKNVYMKDMDFDKNGNPICLYVISNGHEPGPVSAPYEWCITYWNGEEWCTNKITDSDHNYDMGSLYIEDNEWTIVAPIGTGPQKWGVGGEVEIWSSKDNGAHWKKLRSITSNSQYNHAYIRRPLYFRAPFCFFWSDGNAHQFSKSQLYFGDFSGNVWQLPYNMENDFEKPIKIN
jgi:hypothetical protein